MAYDSLIPVTYAEELLRQRGGELSAEQLYAATLLVTGDRRAAELAKMRRALETMQDRR